MSGTTSIELSTSMSHFSISYDSLTTVVESSIASISGGETNVKETKSTGSSSDYRSSLDTVKDSSTSSDKAQLTSTGDISNSLDTLDSTSTTTNFAPSEGPSISSASEVTGSQTRSNVAIGTSTSNSSEYGASLSTQKTSSSPSSVSTDQIPVFISSYAFTSTGTSYTENSILQSTTADPTGSKSSQSNSVVKTSDLELSASTTLADLDCNNLFVFGDILKPYHFTPHRQTAFPMSNSPFAEGPKKLGEHWLS